MKATVGTIFTDARTANAAGFEYARIGREDVLLSRSLMGTEVQNKVPVKITIKEAKVVTGVYDTKALYLGYRAEGSDGNHYVNNWNHFDDASTDPTSYWELEYTGEVPSVVELATKYMWYTATRLIRAHNTITGRRYLDETVEAEILKTIASQWPEFALVVCPEHGDRPSFYKKDGCFLCNYLQKKVAHA